MDEDATWYRNRPRSRFHGYIVLDGVPALRDGGTAALLFSAHVYCGQGRPCQLLLSFCKYITMSVQGVDVQNLIKIDSAVAALHA